MPLKLACRSKAAQRDDMAQRVRTAAVPFPWQCVGGSGNVPTIYRACTVHMGRMPQHSCTGRNRTCDPKYLKLSNDVHKK